MKRRTIGLLLAGTAVAGGIVTTGIANAATMEKSPTTEKTFYGEWRASKTGAIGDIDEIGKKCKAEGGDYYIDPEVEEHDGMYRLVVDCEIRT